MIFDVNWWLGLTAHQLDVVRTIATVFGGAFVPLLGLLLGWAIKLLRATRRDAEAAKQQTGHTEYIDGRQTVVGVVEYARRADEQSNRAVNAGEAARHETGDLAQWLRGNGRYRLPTSDLPRQEPSHYE